MTGFPIVHLDITTADPAATASFYKETFGWEILVDEPSQYTMFKGDGGPGGGFVKPGELYKPGQVVFYLPTNDIEATLQNVEAHGGQRTSPVIEIAGGGGYAFFTDPTGVTVGLYKSGN